MSHTERTSFSSRTPHFFKIILEDTLRENKLRIPNKFTRRYGETLSDSVSIKLPCGSKWKMKLKKHDGKVWLERGWPEFVKHYSIVQAQLLVFRYEGNSQFCAFIFDKSAMEIDYSSVPVHIDDGFRVPKREANVDDSIQILDDFSPSYKTRGRSSLPCSPPPKKVKTGPTRNVRNNLSHSKPEGSHVNTAARMNSMNKGISKTSKSEMKLKNGLPDKSSKYKCTFTRKRKFDTMKPLTRTEKFAVLKKASGFETVQPFFKIVMQPSYVHGNCLTFPPVFARRYLKRSCDVILLKVRDGMRRTWSVKFNFKVYDTLTSVRLRTGWKTFVRDNNLEVGDVCVFVLRKGIPVSFEVVIFRININKTPTMSTGVSAHKRRKVQVKQEEIQMTDTELGAASNNEMGMPRSCHHFHTKQASLNPLTSVEKTRILERAVLDSRKPFFKVVMQPSYVAGSNLAVPLDFAERYLKNEGPAVLLVPNGRSWSAQYRIRSSKAGKHAPVICRGWNAFAGDNDLELGDVCMFELVNGTNISFNVSIVRVSVDNH